MDTNLIIHHRIADIFSQAAKFIQILNVGKEALNLPLACQWFQFVEDVFQLPRNPHLSYLILDLKIAGLPFEGFSPFAFIDLTLWNSHADLE